MYIRNVAYSSNTYYDQNLNLERVYTLNQNV